MRRFERQAEPRFWNEYERRWLYETRGPTVDPLARERDKRTLAAHFHALVRALAQLGPYRFVARKFLATRRRFGVLV